MDQGADLTKTRFRGLRACLLYPADEERLEWLVNTADFMRFHAFQLLNVYSYLVATTHYGIWVDSNEVYTLTVIRQALAIVFNPWNVNANISFTMREAERLYFSGEIELIRTHTEDGQQRHHSPLYSTKVCGRNVR